jgi:hypothetical protein
MAKTNRYINATASFTPTAGTLTPATGLTNYSYAQNEEIQKFSGDGDRFPTTVVQTYADPMISITVGDIRAFSTVALGTKGTVILTVNDAKNIATTAGGGFTITGINALISADNPIGAHRNFASNTYTFHAESADGTTNPFSSAAL